MEGTSDGAVDADGAALLAMEGRPDFDGAPVGNMVGNFESVGRLEGKFDGKEVVDGCPDWEGATLGDAEGRRYCK